MLRKLIRTLTVTAVLAAVPTLAWAASEVTSEDCCCPLCCPGK